MENQRFDDLARLVAAQPSRRQALKALVGVLVGGLFLQMDPERGFAANSACAHWCSTHFAGADASRCTSDAAHGHGLCYTACGPSGNGGKLCCGPGYATTTCCASGVATCLNGGCCPNASVCGAACCGSGSTCQSPHYYGFYSLGGYYIPDYGYSPGGCIGAEFKPNVGSRSLHVREPVETSSVRSQPQLARPRPATRAQRAT
jgi:hypothetical protein